MLKRIETRIKFLAIAAALLGGGIGMTSATGAQSWPNQCYNSDGSLSCPVCGSGCLGGDYLCCNNETELQ
jgi:hypothetical protein